MVDLVQKTLAQDPPVYTPQEAQIAQTFVENMTERLGIPRGNINLAIENSVKNVPAPSVAAPETIRNTAPVSQP